MEITSKEIITATKKEVRAIIIFRKEELLNLNSILCRRKSARYIYRMDRSIKVSKRMDLDKVQGRLLILMGVFTMVNGEETGRKVQVNSSTSTKRSTMGSGSKIVEKVMEPITILMEINMKEIGSLMSSKASEPTITPTATSIKESGQEGSLMVRGIIFTLTGKEFIKGIGNRAKKKVSGN